MDTIDNKYISEAIDELVGSLGIKESIPTKTIRELICAGKVKESIETMANYLGLLIVVNLQYVPATYQRTNIGEGDTSDGFNSSALVKTDSAGRGIEGITAQVSIPSYLPFYGTPGLQGFPVSVKISDNCQRHPEAFTAIMAHELSHVVLCSLWHKGKNNEIYTDLAAMVLGFSKVMQEGRRVVETKQNYLSVVTTTTTFGYLSDEQFDFAFQKIKRILRENIEADKCLRKKVIQKLGICRERVACYQREVLRLRKCIECLDKNPNRKISQQDAHKLVEFHQIGYFDRFEAVVKSSEQRLRVIMSSAAGLVEDTRHYHQRRLASLRTLLDRLDELVLVQQQALDSLHSSVETVAKYIGFFDRFKINRVIRSFRAME